MTDILKVDGVVAQGDMIICRIDELPKDVVSAQDENGNYVLAHSETGHNHVVKKQDGVEFYEAVSNDNIKTVAYLVVNNPREKCLVEHMRGFDTHKPFFFDNGIYIIRRQIESSPEGWRMAAD